MDFFSQISLTNKQCMSARPYSNRKRGYQKKTPQRAETRDH